MPTGAIVDRARCTKCRAMIHSRSDAFKVNTILGVLLLCRDCGLKDPYAILARPYDVLVSREDLDKWQREHKKGKAGI